MKMISQLLDDLQPGRALCAFNTETFDVLRAAYAAAASVGSPVVVAFTVPAAEGMGLRLCRPLCDALEAEFGVASALHLDHCEDVEVGVTVVDARFSSVNFLNEGRYDREGCLDAALELKHRVGGRASLELVLGSLGYSHLHGHDDVALDSATIEEVVKFARSTDPDILGFDCGSVHGMMPRTQSLDLELIRQALSECRIPMVLHGSSGVRDEEVARAVEAAVRKINIETALRTVYMEAVRGFLDRGENTGKPRYLMTAVTHALVGALSRFLEAYSAGAREGASSRA